MKNTGNWDDLLQDMKVMIFIFPHGFLSPILNTRINQNIKKTLESTSLEGIRYTVRGTHNN